jgi:hypothetical protein
MFIQSHLKSCMWYILLQTAVDSADSCGISRQLWNQQAAVESADMCGDGILPQEVIVAQHEILLSCLAFAEIYK